MLSNEHIAIVKSTVPLLEAGGEALTTHFYRIMLAEYPQVRPLFNQAHQASGDQPRALANGVLMYAKHIDRLQALGPLVGQIVQKHVSLQILPEHYPIVGSCLLRAIREDEAAAPAGAQHCRSTRASLRSSTTYCIHRTTRTSRSTLSWQRSTVIQCWSWDAAREGS